MVQGTYKVKPSLKIRPRQLVHILILGCVKARLKWGGGGGSELCSLYHYELGKGTRRDGYADWLLEK